MNQKTWAAALVTLALGVLAFGCQSGGIGDPCTPEDEYQQYFSGYEVSEVNIESKSFQCETRLCLVNHFNGRVSCPYGQTEQAGCDAEPAPGPAVQALSHPRHDCGQHPHPGAGEQAADEPARPRHRLLLVPLRRRDTDARYCKCPTGFQCTKLLEPINRLGSKELAGSYCIKNGTEYQRRARRRRHRLPGDCAGRRAAGSCRRLRSVRRAVVSIRNGPRSSGGSPPKTSSREIWSVEGSRC